MPRSHLRRRCCQRLPAYPLPNPRRRSQHRRSWLHQRIRPRR
ncbi:unnamed protein product [Brassica napus]|nr:unnamed protein product [Brassica napus]